MKGFPNSSVFAMGKFGLRGLAQALARELHPQNIHVGHFVIDGSIGLASKNNLDDEKLDPDHIANCIFSFIGSLECMGLGNRAEAVGRKF